MERIEGMISDIVFKNEDNGYTIAHLANSDNEIVIVGCMPTLSVGESIEVEGKWVNHKTYGTQFEVEKFMPITPSSLEGIYVYLSSGMIHGIGEKMAKRIVDKFGVDTLNVIQNAPERLKEVEEGKNLPDELYYDVMDKSMRKGIIYEIPSGVVFNNAFLSNVGPKVPVKIKYSGNVGLDVKTRVEKYGINSALVEVYIYVEVTQRTILPFQSKDIKLTSEIPVVMKVIKGNAPYYLSGTNGSYNLPIN